MTRNGIASPFPATTGIPASGKWRRRRSTTSSTDMAEPRARQVHGLEVRSKVPAKLPVHRIVPSNSTRYYLAVGTLLAVLAPHATSIQRVLGASGRKPQLLARHGQNDQ